MRTPRKVYDEYRIMPQLQLHQLRVASVAKLICDSFQRSIESQEVILACLFHDMGNIIKSDLGWFVNLIKPEDRPQWEVIKADYIARYGADSHQANVAISEELGLPETVRRLIDGISFSEMERMRDGNSFEQKVCEYADLRVGPYGVLSMTERIEDLHVRYKGKYGPETPESLERRGQLEQAAYDIERQIFERSSIRPGDITDASVASLINELLEYQII